MRKESVLLATALVLAALAACGTEDASDPGATPDGSAPETPPDGAAPDAGTLVVSPPDGGGETDADAAAPDADAAVATHTIGGSITGLSAAGLVLRNNGGDDLAIASGATSFTFATAVAAGAAYDVTIQGQPSGLSCSVIYGSGTVTGPVSNVLVTCVPTALNTRSIGGSITGLSGSGLALRNNGADTLAVAAGAKSFTFPTRVANGGAYAVSVLTQPTSPTQTCSVASGSGNASADVTNVAVTCTTTTYDLGGNVTGLSAGASLTLRNNGGDDLVVSSNGGFTFGTKVPSGATYQVTVQSQPVDQQCTVTQGSGTMGAAPVASVSVSCSAALGFSRTVVGAGLGNANLASGNFAALPLLSQTGVFSNLATLTPHASLVAFHPNAQLWSDAAVKTRWVSVPNDGAPYAAGERVTFTEAGLWTFPTGTVTVKHFELVINEVTGAKKRLETRIGVLQANGTFKGASYRWRADNSDADLVTASASEQNTITTTTGSRTQTHTYPEQAACTQCHLSTSGFALGLRTAQLNGNLAYPGGVTQNQLRAWGRAEMFTAPFSEANIASYLKTVAITDTTASLETRSRSYFEANCSSCHHPGGPNQAWDARFSTPLAQQSILGGEVKAGDPAGSKLWQRMSYATVDTPQKAGQMMPPLAKNHVDTYALDIVGQWISGL